MGECSQARIIAGRCGSTKSGPGQLIGPEEIDRDGREGQGAEESKEREFAVGRKARERPAGSRTEMVEVVLPQDANVFGNILGGRVMHLVDIAAAITAHRHCRSMAVTASVDHIDFRNPIRIGEVIILKASLNRAFHTSMDPPAKTGISGYLRNA